MSVESRIEPIETSTFEALRTIFLLPFPSLFTLEIGGIEEVHFCTSLLQTIVTAPMSCTLRNLSLSVPPGTFSTSLVLPSLPCLEYFSLEMSSDISKREPSDAELSNEDPDKIASFLLSLSSTLESLEISNNSFLLFSSLFVTLSSHPGYFHRLKFFSLLDSTLDVPAFHGFLCTLHNTLEHLDLKIVDLKLVDAWLAGIIHGFPSLHCLVVQPPSSVKGLNSLSALLQSTTTSLAKLALVGHLDNEDVPVLFSTLSSSNLRALEISIQLLTVPILNLIAGTFPHLEELKIEVYQVDEVNVHPFQVSSAKICYLYRF